jgi:hypothetical protein
MNQSAGYNAVSARLFHRLNHAHSCRRILIFPRGNHVRYKESLSAYLECPDLDRNVSGWTLRTDFELTLVHPVDDERSICKSELRSRQMTYWKCS